MFFFGGGGGGGAGVVQGLLSDYEGSKPGLAASSKLRGCNLCSGALSSYVADMMYK